MNNKKGFTLVELLVVIAIIGILSTVAVVNLNIARNKAKVGALEAALKSIVPEIILCFDDGYNIKDGGGDDCGVGAGDWDKGAPMCVDNEGVIHAYWPNLNDIEENIPTSPCEGNPSTGEFSYSASVAGFTVTCTQNGCSSAPTP